MGITTLPHRYRVNGLIDTSKPVLDNLELIANGCATWITYDIMDGKWAVVINKAAPPEHQFDNSNIVGPVNLSSTGLADLYNGVEVRFPHRDLRDQQDFVRIDLPAQDLLPNELPNRLVIDLPLVNEPVQAQIVGLIELKQARLDKIITFTVDYSLINLQAGDVIAVTNSVYGWSGKTFRVIRMEEVDVDGTIAIDVTALEYDANVYDLSDLYRYVRSNADGIITQGQIGKPGQPQVTRYEINTRPGLFIETTVPDNLDPLNPAGIVEGMEFWIYQIPPGELPTWQTVDDDTRAYSLLATKRPSATNVFEPGETITLDWDQLDAANYLVKTRAVNSTTAGPYSDLSGLVDYIPTQVPAATIDNTPLLDQTGNSLQGLALANLIGWALSKSGGLTGGWAGLLDQMGYTENDFYTVNGGPANQTVELSRYTFSTAQTNTGINTQAGTATLNGFGGPGGVALQFLFNIPYGGSALQIFCESPYGTWSYQYWDPISNSAQINTGLLAYYPILINVYKGATLVTSGTVDWQTQSTFFTLIPPEVPGQTFAGNWAVRYSVIPTYDLNMDNPYKSRPEIFCYNFVASRSTSVTFNLIQ